MLSFQILRSYQMYHHGFRFSLDLEYSNQKIHIAEYWLKGIQVGPILNEILAYIGIPVVACVLFNESKSNFNAKHGDRTLSEDRPSGSQSVRATFPCSSKCLK